MFPKDACILPIKSLCMYMMCSEGIYKCIKYGFFNEKLVLQMYKYDKKISADMNIWCVCICACLTVNPCLLSCSSFAISWLLNGGPICLVTDC